ncbi:hypothetical protein [Brasilonema bromeliae]|nr:hypothetical protein [Brasilonema bromeliae]
MIVEEERDRHLKKFRPAKSADSKALYEKRLLAFVQELLDRLRSI